MPLDPSPTAASLARMSGFSYTAKAASAIAAWLAAARTAILAATGTADAALPRSGGVMSGDIDMDGQKVIGLADGVDPADAVTKSQLDAAVLGLYDIKGALDCSTNPNYPAASKGDVYVCSVAGKVGGVAGLVVEVGDQIVALADNAGGDQAAVGTSWTISNTNVTVSTDGTMADNSDALVPSQKAAKAYTDAVKKAPLSPPQWNDLVISATAVNPPGVVSAPTYNDAESTLDFSAAGTERIDLAYQLPHGWVSGEDGWLEGSEVRFHLHAYHSTAGAGNVRWQLTWRVLGDPGTVIPAWTTEFVPIAAPGNTNMALPTLKAFDMTGYKISCVLQIQLTRTGADLADTYAGVVRVASLDLHYQLDTPGSASEFMK